jgi:hypothetical protein
MPWQIEPLDVPPELVAAKEAVEAELLSRAGVTGVGIGLKEVGGEATGELAIRVMVERKMDVADGAMVPPDLMGFLTDVVERRFEQEQVTPDLDPYEPLRGGISGGPCATIGGLGSGGTLGAFVRRNSLGGKMAMISNAHVLGHVGIGPAVQPEVGVGRCPRDVIGTVVASSLADPAAAHTVDAALIELSGVRGERYDVVDVGELRGTTVAQPGMRVKKRGKTTRLTFGIVYDTFVTCLNEHGQLLRDQIAVEADADFNPRWSDQGDSGSLVLTRDDRAVGLHWGHGSATTGVANPIRHVESVLDVAVAFKPVITSASLAATWAGPFAPGPVTLTGRGFAGGDLFPKIAHTQVFFGGTMATVTFVTDDTLIVTPPVQPFPTHAPIEVRYGWEVSDPIPFDYEALPVVAAVTPFTGSTAGGEVVTITGVGLLGAQQVIFGSESAAITSISDNFIEVLSPPMFGAGTVEVRVVKAAGGSAPWIGSQFTYV